jgi:hypothetical protein
MRNTLYYGDNLEILRKPPTNVSFKRAEKARQTNNEHEKSLLED